MEFIKKHKTICIIAVVILLVFIGLYLFIRKLSPDARKNLYGNRLEGIEKVKINTDRVDSMILELKKVDGIKDVKYNIKGRLINITLKVIKDLDVNKAKEYSTKTLEYFGEKEKKYYDMQIFIISEEENENYPFIGYRHKTRQEFVWKQ